jgi:ATP phosphoribosyltransferase
MSDDNETHEEEVVTEVKEELDDKGKTLSEHDLKQLEEKLHAEIRSIRSDKTTDAEEKAVLEAKVDKLTERIEGFLTAQEEKDKKKDDSSTMVVPPAALDTPTHLNVEDVKAENENEPIKKSRGWKRAW